MVRAIASPRSGCRGTITVSSDGKNPASVAVRLEQDFLFAGMGRGRDDDRAAARHRHQPLELGGIGRRRRNIELQIARGDDVAAAERGKALGVDLRLREADLEPAEQRRDRAAQPGASAETSAATSGR